MKPKVLYQECREGNNIDKLLADESSNRMIGDYQYSLRVTVTRYDFDVVVLEIHTNNRPGAKGFDTTRLLLNTYKDFAAIREGIKAFDTALGQFEPDEG